MSKNADTRWNDTITYLNNKFPIDRPGDHINTLVPQPQRAAISGELSLGWRFGVFQDDAAFQATTEKRHALRGLLLCQRVYFSDQFWARQSEAGEGLKLEPFTGLVGAGWKERSFNYWKGRSELDILAGIAMFVPRAGASRQDLADAAFAGPPNGVPLPGNWTVSRNDAFTVGNGVTCYVGVQGWLVRSGIVSMRWFMSNAGPNKQLGCDGLFGAGQEVWRGPIKPNDIPRLQGIINNIGAGYVVHIWSPQNYNWNGHWVITNGDGTICGVNNGEFRNRNPPVQKNYTKHSTLLEQFEGYGEVLDAKADVWRTAVMAVIDPMTMPNRM